MYLSGRKGQTFMPDFLAGLLIFGTVIGVFFASYQGIISNKAGFETENQLRTQAVHTSAFLVSTPGFPENWEEDTVDVEVPGLVSSSNLIESDKFLELKSLSYTRQRQLLQTPEFYMELRNESGRMELSGDEFWTGKDFADASTVVPINRNVLLNHSTGVYDAEMRYVSWR